MSDFANRPIAPADGKRRSPRRAVLDLAPLELDCMNTLWPMGEGTVREIRDRLAERLPRAYTTIMTIMDRLARKGIVERCKSGRAYVYRANLSVQEARAQALGHVVEKFFGGSREALLAQLGAASPLTLAAAAASTTSPGAAAPVLPTSAASEIESRKTGDLAVSAKPAEPD
ncbi:MAG: BlaI/MecI/CopY family transcriptional regulator [Candidatus Acidiferrales bacterium]